LTKNLYAFSSDPYIIILLGFLIEARVRSPASMLAIKTCASITGSYMPPPKLLLLPPLLKYYPGISIF
jgi:hypothetical protein